jgi:hypothetical protein
LATARAAMMLFEIASLPDSLRVSLKMIIGDPPIPAILIILQYCDFSGSQYLIFYKRISPKYDSIRLFQGVQ